MMLLSPVGLVIAAVVGLGIAIVTFADEIAPYITDVINYFITLYNESDAVRMLVGYVKTAFVQSFKNIWTVVGSVIDRVKDLGKAFMQVLSGDFEGAFETMRNGLSKTFDDLGGIVVDTAAAIRDGINAELAKDPIELVNDETVASAIKNLGGIRPLINDLLSGGGGGGAGATVTPTPTETVTVQADLEFQEIEFIDDADLDEEDIDKVIERTNLVKNQINSIAQSMANFIDSTFRSIIDGTATFEEVMRNMIKQMLIQLASLIAQFAILSVLMPGSSLVKGGLGKFIGGGFGIPQMASGGIVSGPVIAQVGEYSGAQHNPEVIAPLDKLQSMMGGQSVQVTGKISGRDILLTSERNAIDRNRVRGF